MFFPLSATNFHVNGVPLGKVSHDTQTTCINAASLRTSRNIHSKLVKRLTLTPDCKMREKSMQNKMKALYTPVVGIFLQIICLEEQIIRFQTACAASCEFFLHTLWTSCCKKQLQLHFSDYGRFFQTFTLQGNTSVSHVRCAWCLPQKLQQRRRLKSSFCVS